MNANLFLGITIFHVLWQQYFDCFLWVLFLTFIKRIIIFSFSALGNDPVTLSHKLSTVFIFDISHQFDNKICGLNCDMTIQLNLKKHEG